MGSITMAVKGSQPTTAWSQPGKKATGTMNPDRKIIPPITVANPRVSSSQKAATLMMNRNAKLITTAKSSVTASRSQMSGVGGRSRS